jgi:uncharacterized protein (DUF58 family)
VYGSRPGTHLSRLRGRAPELSEYRLYRQGDDPRDLDWKLLARSDRAFVRLSDDRAIHPTMLLLDASASMAWPTDSLTKWHALGGVAVGLASLAQQAGDPVGAVIVGKGEPVRCAPSARPDVLARLIHALSGVEFGATESLAAVWSHLPPRAREVLVSDLLGDDDACRREAAARIAAGSEVVVVHVISSAELDPPRDIVLARDPDAPGVVRPFDDAARGQYREAFQAWQERTRGDWTSVGARYIRIIAEEDLAHALRSIVHRPGSG